jgi:hypothetical protein
LEILLDEERDKNVTYKKMLEKGPQKILEKRVAQLSELCQSKEQAICGFEIQVKMLEKKVKRLSELVIEGGGDKDGNSTSIRGMGTHSALILIHCKCSQTIFDLYSIPL